MKEILDTTHLTFNKSSFIIRLVKHSSGSVYIEIKQEIIDENYNSQVIKINPFNLTDIIKVLQNYHANLPLKYREKITHIIDSDEQKIQDRYLKGISIKDLAMQFDQSEKLIEQILINSGIQIVSNKLPKKRWWKRRK
ncbi:MAG TPA: hypothetical protein VK921_09840 [Anditalea sp.]|nr:hypothetical protein [Anditalea sp.]